MLRAPRLQFSSPCKIPHYSAHFDWPLRCDPVCADEVGQMETIMAGAATFEIFVASVAIATGLGLLALRGMFWLMHGAANAGRPATIRLRSAARVPAVAQARVTHVGLMRRLR